MRRITMPIALLIGLIVGSTRAESPRPAQVRTIEVHAHRFAFAPAEVTVKAGETIQIKLISDDVPHSLVVRQLAIDATASKAHPSEAEFTAKQAGDFEGHCGRFCGNGHGRMSFVIHVTEN